MDKDNMNKPENAVETNPNTRSSVAATRLRAMS